MRPTSRLLHACRITLFTRPNCSLCHDAKLVLSKVWDQRPFEYHEVDVMEAGQEKWKSIYEFDVPVVHIEPSAADLGLVVAAARKLMHRFGEADVQALMDQASDQASGQASERQG